MEKSFHDLESQLLLLFMQKVVIYGIKFGGINFTNGGIFFCADGEVVN